MIAFINNDFVPYEKAFLHVSDLSVQRGYGVFDFLKVTNGQAFFIDDYLDRFFQSAIIMRLEIPLTRDELKDAVKVLIEKNGLASSGIKMVLTGGYSLDGFQPAAPNLVITQQELILPSPEVIAKGVKVMLHEYVRDIPEAKTINYTMGIWLLEKMRAANAYDVLYHRDGEISEFPRSNFFIVRRDGTVVTPAKNILRGVTRKNVLQLAAKHMRAEEATVTLDDLWNAKEAFITSTTKQIIPVTHVEGRAIGNGVPGEVSSKLLRLLIEMEGR